VKATLVEFSDGPGVLIAVNKGAAIMVVDVGYPAAVTPYGLIQ
jgi:hypothetical protein